MTDLPVWGASAPSTSTDDRKTKLTLREQQRQEVFDRNASKEVPWREVIRTANNQQRGGYGHINFEGVYRGFRKRLLEDPAFEHQITELILDRIMAELFVPLNHTPRAGLKLSIARKPKVNGHGDD